MNHGLCKNCWWYKVIKNEGYYLDHKLIWSFGEGKCYMHTTNPCKEYEEPHIVPGDSWCPDYCNRKKTEKSDKKTLNQWLEGLKVKIFNKL